MHDLTFNHTLDSHTYSKLFINNCDKDGSLVSKRIASAVDAVSATRNININVDRETDFSYFKDMANRLACYYSVVESSPLLNSDVLVLSSVHRTALYIAEVLHAPILPLQIISFADSWEQALKTETLSIAGSDFDVPYIWQWNKIGHISHFPQKYIDMMSEASELVLVRATDSVNDCPIIGRYKNLYINSTIKLNKKYWNSIKLKLQQKDANYSSIRQWEWGLSDITVNTTKEMWLKLGKDLIDFHIIEFSSIDLYQLIPLIWEYYLQKNSIPIRGFMFNAYWIAHPYYERYAGLLPIHFYKFKTIKNLAEEYAKKYNNVTISPDTVCVFANNVGSNFDVMDLSNFLKSLSMNQFCWFSNGFDSSDAICRDIFGYAIPKPFEKVCEWIQSAPYRKNNFTSMTVNEVEEILKKSK